MYKSTVQIPFVLFKQVRTKHITFTIEFYNKLQNTEKNLLHLFMDMVPINN